MLVKSTMSTTNCSNCEYHGFPCLNCADYVHLGKLGPGCYEKHKVLMMFEPHLSIYENLDTIKRWMESNPDQDVLTINSQQELDTRFPPTDEERVHGELARKSCVTMISDAELLKVLAKTHAYDCDCQDL